MKPLYGYDSAENSYMVNDYPYGRDRCRIRFWLECDKKRGFRFCSQTEHPRKLIWNAPKRSTYSLLAGCMYLDDQGHCVWSGLSEYSKAEDVLQFLTQFPGADLSQLRPFVLLKVPYLKRYISGETYMTINGVKQEHSEADVARLTAELAIWEQCKEKLPKAGA